MICLWYIHIIILYIRITITVFQNNNDGRFNWCALYMCNNVTFSVLNKDGLCQRNAQRKKN